jgi:crotonobetainyl-CoA:carnitine CoA-transferase CaiB-like acyl-CoA transferase
MGPLNGVRVIDLTSILMGPFATQFLGDFGADVIKVEPPGGDLVRNVGPSRSPAMGPLFLNVNRSKRSVSLDLKTPEGRGILLDLCREADLLVYNLRPAAMTRLGLSWEEVQAVNPRLIYAGLYGYGQGGRYGARPAYDDLIQGGSTMSHLFTLSGDAEPRYVPSAIADRVVGLTALSGILAALYERSQSGEGQRIDVAMFETMVGFVLGDHLGGLSFDPPLDGGGYARQLSPERRPLHTADGHVCALLYTDQHWRRFLRAIGEEQVMDDPRFATFSSRLAHVSEVYGWLNALFLGRTSAEWLAVLEAADVPAMMMHSFASVMEDPHLKDVGFFSRSDHPSEGPVVTMANPVRMSATPVGAGRHAPRLGEHTVEVLRELGLSEARIGELVARGIATPETAESGRGATPVPAP